MFQFPEHIVKQQQT